MSSKGLETRGYCMNPELETGISLRRKQTFYSHLEISAQGDTIWDVNIEIKVQQNSQQITEAVNINEHKV